MESSITGSEVLPGAPIKSELQNEPVYRRYIDRLVLPGMILQLRDSSGAENESWSIGPGLLSIPARLPCDSKHKVVFGSVLVRQMGILRCKANEVASEVIGKQSILTAAKSSRGISQHRSHHIWLEQVGCASNFSTKVLSALCRSKACCHVGQFQSGHRVVGVVTRKAGDIYMVDIGCPSPASLSYLAFEGASKKNRPDIHPGDVVYAVITQADRDLEIELSCVDEAGKSSGMGILGRHEPGTVGNAGGMDGGVLLQVSIDLIRRLGDQDKFPLLRILAKVFPFEVCLGANGRIWLTARSARETMLLANTLSIAAHIPSEVCCKLASELC